MKALLYFFSSALLIKSDAIPVPDTLYVNSYQPTSKTCIIVIIINS